ncbi:MAG TPA: SGNH/GDSL hydrolase family protein [Pseudonocardia sp.]|jgi:lysophospholipase L1-like esterase
MRRRRATRVGTAALAALGACLVTTTLLPGRAMAAPAGDPASEYVALGDSYTAGPLIPAQHGTPSGCLRSDHNYPSLVNTALRAPTFRDVSCSGATTQDLTAPQAVTGGSNPPQLNALTERTQLVSLGIGGNDIGFAKIIEECAKKSAPRPLGSACRDYYNRSGSDELAARIAAAGPKVAGALRAVADRAPDATVLVVGYPTILPDSGSGCYPVVPFSPKDVAYLRQVEQGLNAMLAREARDAGARFVDTYTPSIGHDICKLPGTKWVEGLVPTAPAAPVHPNTLGMRNSANAVLATLHVKLLAAGPLGRTGVPNGG